MSNPAVYTLVDGKINGKTLFRIEDNLGESIHIHIDDITIYLTIKEFENLVKSFYASAKELLSEQGISLEQIDITSLDWNWMKKYDQISNIKIKKVFVKDLFTVDKVFKNEISGWRYVKVSKSKDYRALRGNKKHLNQYKEFNLYGQDSFSRLIGVKNHIEKNGYPFENKYIVVNQYNIIYDGAHRAASLAYLYGEDYEIPVMEFSFENDLPVSTINKNNRKKLRKQRIKSLLCHIFRIRKFFINPLKAIRNLLNKRALSRHKEQVSFIDFDKFEQYVLLSGVKCFLIDKQKIDRRYNKISDYSLVVDEKQLVDFVNYLSSKNIYPEKNSIYIKYNLLYGLELPLIYKVGDKKILVSNKLLCKSYFYDALLPIDSTILSLCWEHVLECCGSLAKADDIIIAFSIIVDAMLEQRLFTDKDKIFLSSHKRLLMSSTIKTMLEKVFFKYSGYLLELLRNDDFEKAIEEYILFREY